MTCSTPSPASSSPLLWRTSGWLRRSLKVGPCDETICQRSHFDCSRVCILSWSRKSLQFLENKNCFTCNSSVLVRCRHFTKFFWKVNTVIQSTTHELSWKNCRKSSYCWQEAPRLFRHNFSFSDFGIRQSRGRFCNQLKMLLNMSNNEIWRAGCYLQRFSVGLGAMMRGSTWDNFRRPF